MNGFEQVIQKSNKPTITDKDDYYNNGLLYCGKCHTPKECKITFNDKSYTVGCLCLCEQEKLTQEKEQKEKEQKLFLISQKKKKAFPNIGMINFNFESADNTELKLKNAMKKYCDNFNKFKERGEGFILLGNTSTGKTYIACCVINRLIDLGYSSRLLTISQAERELANCDYCDRKMYMDNLSKLDLLVIDDLGSERSSSYIKSLTFEIVNARCDVGKPIICTTNLTLKELTETSNLDDKRIFERLLFKCQPVTVSEVNHRLKQRDNIQANELKYLGLI